MNSTNAREIDHLTAGCLATLDDDVTGVGWTLGHLWTVRRRKGGVRFDIEGEPYTVTDEQIRQWSRQPMSALVGWLLSRR